MEKIGGNYINIIKSRVYYYWLKKGLELIPNTRINDNNYQGHEPFLLV